MKILPILFNTEMVRAILDGRKTVTRRICKDGNDFSVPDMSFYDPSKRTYAVHSYADIEHTDKLSLAERTCPICPEDILYVRETWNYGYIETSESTGNYEAWFEPFRPDEEPGSYIEAISVYFYKADKDAPGSENRMVWRPSIHMPKEAARIWLKITNVRVERLQDMTLDDFLSEGVVIRPEAFNDPENAYLQARSEFARIWDSTIRNSQTDLNPWVWVIEFERCGKPEK